MKIFSWDDRRRDRYCTIEPITAAALIGGGTALAGSGLSFMGANKQNKAIRAAMERYLADLRQQRQTFLDQPESQEIRRRMQGYLGGEVGYNPQILRGMRAGVTEDYGKSLADMTRLTKSAGAGSSGVMTPGRADRTSRLLGQNIASNRATSMRDIATKNADVALNNQRFAVSAMPSYLPGLPSTPTPGPDIYSAGIGPGAGSYIGPGLSQAGQTASQMMLYGPIMQKMMEQSPYAAMYMMPSLMNPSPSFSGSPEMQRRLFPTQ